MQNSHSSEAARILRVSEQMRKTLPRYFAHLQTSSLGAIMGSGEVSLSMECIGYVGIGVEARIVRLDAASPRIASARYPLAVHIRMATIAVRAAQFNAGIGELIAIHGE
jgi:hypothetical protein